jgi:pyruvate formate lyase activating enzyme
MSEPACVESDWRSRILIGGFNPATQHDWPNRLAATIFLRGCPWRCAYCHNPQLQRRGREPGLAWADIEAHLSDPACPVDSVVFSGGEACVDRHLPEAVAALKAMGLRVGLHTNGAYPERLATLLPQLDWVGIDLKTDYAHYDALTGVPGSGALASESARLVMACGIDHEFRLTWHPTLMGDDEALLVSAYARALGVRHFALQCVQATGDADRPCAAPEPPAALLARLGAGFEHFVVRQVACGLAPTAPAPAEA